MDEKKSEKLNKNLYLPVWIVEMLDAEGENYGGPGTVASTAIMAFCGMNNAEKQKALKRFRDAEINHAYAVQDEVVAQSAAKGRKRTLSDKSSKAG